MGEKHCVTRDVEEQQEQTNKILGRKEGLLVCCFFFLTQEAVYPRNKVITSLTTYLDHH